jgi:hypothetical protein
MPADSNTNGDLLAAWYNEVTDAHAALDRLGVSRINSCTDSLYTLDERIKLVGAPTAPSAGVHVHLNVDGPEISVVVAHEAGRT